MTFYRLTLNSGEVSFMGKKILWRREISSLKQGSFYFCKEFVRLFMWVYLWQSKTFKVISSLFYENSYFNERWVHSKIDHLNNIRIKYFSESHFFYWLSWHGPILLLERNFSSCTTVGHLLWTIWIFKSRPHRWASWISMSFFVSKE